MKTEEIKDNTFDDLVHKNSGLVIIGFIASWCQPCLMMEPVIENIATELGKNAAVGKLDIDRNPVTTARFNVFHIPTLILFDNGKVVKRFSGAAPKNVVLEKFNLQAA